MKHRVLYLFMSLGLAGVFLIAPVGTIAEREDPEPTLPLPVIITEIQTGAATASDEFIELYNQSDQPVDIAGWQIRYINSTVTTGATTLLATITPIDGDSLLLESGEYFVLHTASVVLPSEILGQQFTAALSKTDKTVALFARNEAVCHMEVHDAIAWEATPGTTVGEGAGVVVSSTDVNKDKLLQRFRDSAGLYVDTNHNSLDVTLSTTFSDATPGAHNLPILANPAGEVGPPSALAAFEAPDCTVPDPDPDPPVDLPTESPPSVTDPDDDPADDPAPTIPTGNIGLKSPLLSELLPNPASPQTDANDEFIELYNPNDQPFTLSGYVLEVGTSTKRRYVFPAGTTLPPKTFVAFFSADTGLALSNSGGQVRLIDPLGKVLTESQAYGTAKDNQVWVLANGVWQWSLTPTPNAVNVIKAPETKAKQTASSKKSTTASSNTKGASTTGANDEDDQAAAAATTNSGTPLHPGVLALVGSFALLYGAYEYRHDIANKIRQFRTNRATRRALR